jgi:predicted phosphate transport protein (TIGR00153 family)
MFGKLMPKEAKFFDLFNVHAELCVNAATELLELMRGSPDDFERRMHAIENIEEKADDVVHETVRALRKTFITPLDRDDIHRLISRMDDIIDLIEDSAQAVSLYNIETITPEAFRLAELCLLSCEKLKEGIGMLNNMKNAQRILALCEEVDQLETENDHVTYEAMSNLFRNEPDTRTLIKLKALYELLENVCDICEEVGNIVEGIVVENA